MSSAATPIAVLVKPLGELWGWSRAEATFIVSINALIVLLVGPLVATALRRWGFIRLPLLAVTISAFAQALAGFSGPNLYIWYALWTVFAIAYLGNGVLVWASAITYLFEQRRGFALALVLSGVAAGHAVLPLATHYLYDALGISWTFVALAASLLLSGGGAVMLLSKSQLNHLLAERLAQVPKLNTSLWNTMALILSRPTFWQLAIGFVALGLSIGSIAIHFVAIMTDAGITSDTAAWVLALFGPSVLVGRFVGAWLLDRVSAQVVVLPFFVGPLISCLILSRFTGDIAAAVAVITLAGVAMGAEGDMLAYFVGRYFGSEKFAQLYPLMFGIFVICFGFSPVLAGYAFEVLGGYDLVYTGFSVMLLLGLGAMLSLGPYRY